MRKLKIAHILNSVGGVDVSLRLILKHINSEKFESIVIHGEKDTDTDYLDNKGRKIKDYKVSIERDISIFRDLKAIYSTYKIIKKERPNIIHAHSAKGGIIAKTITTFLKIPVLHTPQAYSFLSAQNGLKRSIYLGIEKIFRGPNNKILASSKSEQNRAIKEVGYKPEAALLFNNSIDPIPEVVSELSIAKTWPDLYICTVGRPSYQKNTELLLQVLAKVKEQIPDIHLVIAGVGYHSPNLKKVKSLINELSLNDNVTMLEWTSREDIFNIIKNSKFYVTSARYEGLPYSVIESLALGKAVIATDSDGNRDLVVDNFNGFLVKNDDSNLFVRRIINLFNSDMLSAKFSQNSLILYEENFNMHKNIRILEDIYVNNI